MIDYKLAKQLKEAGFPQKGKDGSFYVGENRTNPFIPTLSELIEACGFPIFLSTCDGKHFYAKNAEHSEAISEEGKSFKEAVAKLFIELNKKNAKKNKTNQT